MHRFQLMTRGMLDQIANLDAECFDRINHARSIENLRTMLDNSPGGCYVMLVREQMVGYIFTHRLGLVGYLGPLGVKPAFRGLGYGKDIVDYGIRMLRAEGCSTIGLEVLPESGHNIGLYSRAGFRCTYPTIMLGRRNRGREEIINVVSAQEIAHKGQLQRFLDGLTIAGKGYSLETDLLWALQNHPDECFFYWEDEEIKGFLAYTLDLYPFVWGAISSTVTDPSVLNLLYSAVEKRHRNVDIKVRVNTRYKKIDWFFSLGFKVERSFLCMLLNGSEGSFQNQDTHGLVLRAWMG